MSYRNEPDHWVRILEEINFWKIQETEHARLIQSSTPDLEEPFVNLLNEWEQLFTTTSRAAATLLQTTGSEVVRDTEALWVENAKHLLQVALEQSDQFARQLQNLSNHSVAVQNQALGQALIGHVISESQYFINSTDSITRTSELQELKTTHQTLDTPLAETRNPQPVPIGGHTLPPLPYAYNALEPYIDEETMRIHHDKHHQSYVDGLNKAEIKLQEARKSGDFDLVKHWERELAFNGAGHYLHTIFWTIMSPNGGGKPEGDLLKAIERDFGSYKAFKEQFSKAAENVEGGGWAILVWSPRSHRLEILTAEKHQNLSQWDVVPLLALDVWEHAYYLKHQNQRAKYIEDWWNVVNWPEVSYRYDYAKQLMWTPY
jgi:Fe-Mn family superoxide dismutase